ncbi:TolC family protein [Novosphingobium sp.]|uniref:TolC family protein n=1 Tax=Novosphingobium sp. TaxID=1874826 RepID=UPI00286DBFE7|nr:TolC family protein [Novosphingobium sp.]
MRSASLLIAVALAALSADLQAEPGLPDKGQPEKGLPALADVAAALDAHPAVLAANARTSAAGAEARVLQRGPHEFSITASYVRRSVDREGRFDEYDATLSRAVRLPGKARLDREIGAAGLEASRNRAEDARHQAALLLAQGWWDWLGAAGEAVVDRQAVENYSRMLAATRRRVSLRDAAELEANQAEGALGAARVAAEQSAGREAVARARLAAQFPGLPIPGAAPEVPRPELPEGGIEHFGSKIISRSHEIAAAEAEALRMVTVAERVRRDRIADPSVGLRLFSERNGAERGAGFVVSMPLGGGRRRAEADRAEAEAGAARAEAMAARFAVNEMAATDLAEARSRYESWVRAREGVKAQVAALVKLRLGQAAGEFGLADVLLGERQVHDAFRMEVLARTEAQRALTRLRIDSHELWILE